MSSFWHSFSDMSVVDASGPLVIDRGRGVHIWDTAGRRYIDATAALWYCTVGYGRDEIADAAATQMRRLPAYSTFGDLSNAPAEELAERVSEIAPVAGSRVFFTSGGSDSIDTTTKMARRYWQLRGQPDRSLFVNREGAYHGMHVAGTSLAGIESNAGGHGDLLQSDVLRVPWNDAGALRTAIEGAGPGRVAAFFCEPVIGAGGVLAPPPGYLESVRAICREFDVLLVADEVITGFGRMGAWFASERFDLEPDIVTCAKGLTSGYIPMGAVIVAPRVAEPFADGTAGIWRHGYTYSGHATAAAAALANLAIIEREDLVARAGQLEKSLEEALRPLASHPSVDEVRAGAGALAAIQPSRDAIASDPAYPLRLVAECRRAGVMTRTLATGALQISPALVLDDAELDELAAGIATALDAVG